MNGEKRICLLVTVYLPYRWCAEFTLDLLDRFWPSHPPVFFCGLTSEEAGRLPHIPIRDPGGKRVWAQFALDAATDLAGRGYDLVYFMLEDHPPLGRCNARHLEVTLPGLVDSLPASYIGLLGWDNRRFAARGGAVLPAESYRLMHLTEPRAPRFHLHPSLFRMSALLACLEAVSRSERPDPWGFEKLCDKPDAPLPEIDKAGCYQVCGEELAAIPPARAMRWTRAAERFLFHRAMSIVPHLRKIGLDMFFWDALGFDNFFYEGPLPMFYSGIMSRKRVNPYLLKFFKRHPDPAFAPLLERAAKENSP